LKFRVISFSPFEMRLLCEDFVDRLLGAVIGFLVEYEPILKSLGDLFPFGLRFRNDPSLKQDFDHFLHAVLEAFVTGFACQFLIAHCASSSSIVPLLGVCAAHWVADLGAKAGERAHTSRKPKLDHAGGREHADLQHDSVSASARVRIGPELM
jgi:hypothetical protein